MENYLSYVTDIFLILGIIISMIQLFFNRLVVKADHERRKKEATIVFAHEIISNINRLSKSIEHIFGDDYICSADNRYDIDIEGWSVRGIIEKYLDLMERMSVGLNTCVYDINIFYRLCGRQTINWWNRLKGIIDENEREQKNEHSEFRRVVDELKSIHYRFNKTAGDIAFS